MAISKKYPPQKTKPRSPEGDSRKREPEADSFPVVGIGASAGGLDAIERILKNLPVKSGMAFLLVQHLDPQHESRLAEILSKVTSDVSYGNKGWNAGGTKSRLYHSAQCEYVSEGQDASIGAQKEYP